MQAHLVDSDFSFVQVFNGSPEPVTIARHERLGTVADTEFATAYLLENSSDQSYDPDTEEAVIRLNVDDAFDHVPVQVANEARRDTDLAMPNDEHIKILSNGITIYAGESEQVVRRLEELVCRYDVWANENGSNVGTVRIPPDQWMRVPMKDGWQDRMPKPKVYHQLPKSRALIDKMFDGLYRTGKMNYAVGHTPSAYPVFVVWKDVWDPTTNSYKEKGRVVVDLRGANKEAEPDLYPVPSQDEIINLLRGCRYITAVDACRFFYQ